MVDDWDISNLTEPFFRENSPNLSKNCPKWLQNSFFLFFEKCCHQFSWKWSKMKTSIFIHISPINDLVKFWFSSYGPKWCWPIELQGSLKCNIAGTKWMMKIMFDIQRKTEISYKLILSFWVCLSRRVQSTQNKFAYLCKISRKTWGVKFFFSCR